MAPTIQRKVLKFYREGKQHVDDYLAGVEHGDLKNLGALCSNWSAVVFALATLIALYALGLYRKGLMTTWKMFLSTTAIVALLFCLTVFGYVTGHCMKTMDALESRARGAGQNVGEPRVKVCGQCDAPFANQHTNPAGNRWICASCGMISRKPKLATKETLAGKAKTEECHARSSLDRSPATEAATKEAEERRQVAKQSKELRRRHAREVKEAREAADRADREEIARLVEEERSRKEAARAEEALERAAAEEEQRRLREEEEVAARAAKEEEEAVAKAEEEAERASAERASREPTERRRVTSLTKIPAPRPVNVAVAHPPLPPSLPPLKQQQQQQQQRAAVPPAGVMTHAPTRPPPTPRSSDSPASPNTPMDFDPPLPPMRPMTGPPTPTSPAWGGAANGTNGSPHAPMSPHAGVSTSPTHQGGSPSSHPPPHGALPGFWSGGALGGLGLGAAGIRGILDGDEEVAAGVGVVGAAPPPPPGPPPGYAGRVAGTTNAPATNAPPLPAGPPPTSAAKRTPPPGQPPLPPMPHPSQVAAAAAAEKGGNPRAFLASLELEAYALTFERERISLADISLLTESDLERLGLPLGPRRRILAAISGVNVSGGGTAVGHVGQRTAGIVPPGAPSISPNPFRVPRSSSVDSDTFGDGGIAGLTPLPNVGISGSPGMGVPGISGWNGGGFGGGLFGGFAPTAVSAVSTASMANNGHSRQRSQSSDMDALAMDSLENDLMALTGGLNLDDDDEETEVEPRGSSAEDESSAFTLPGTPPKPPALDQLDAESLVALQTAEAADNNNNKQHQQVDPPKPPSEMMVKAAARLRAAAAAGHQIPQEFFCCITCEVMVDPVIAWDGHTYERDPIARWLQEHSTSPMTGETLPDFTLRPNHSMRSQIISYGERLEASR